MSKVPKKLIMTSVGLAGAMALRKWSRRYRNYDFFNKVALVTGGSRGLGLLLAVELVKRGARVSICARDEEELRRAKHWIEVNTRKTIDIHRCDVASDQDVRAMIEKIEATYGGLDVLINNAGVMNIGAIDTLDTEDFKSAFDVIYWGTHRLVNEALPALRKSRGRIVNITSVGGRVSIPHLLPYCTAKFAATSFSLGLRAELEKDGICVTTVTPGLMRTGSFDQANFKESSTGDYTWFALSSSLPLLTTDARKAAHEIIDAACKGVALKNIGTSAAITGALAGAFPGFTANCLALVNRLLPRPHRAIDGYYAETDVSGESLHSAKDSKVFDFATRLGRQAKNEFQEHHVQ